MTSGTATIRSRGSSRRAGEGKRISQTAQLVLFFALGSGCLFLFVAGLLLGVRGADVPLLGWTAVTIFVAFVPLLLDQARPPMERHVLLSMVSIVFMVQFVLPVFTHYIPAEGPSDPSGMSFSNLMPADIARTQAIALAGLLALMLGYALPLGSGLASAIPPPRREWTHASTLIAAIVLIPIGWAVFLSLQFGIVPQRVGSGISGGLASLSLFGIALLTVAYVRHRSRVALVLIGLLVPMTMAFNFLTGSKRLVLTPPALVAMTWIVMQRRIRFRWIAAGLLALVMLYPVSQYWRDVVLVQNTRSAADILRNPGPALSRTLGFVSSAKSFDYLGEGLERTGKRLDSVGHAAVILRDTPSVSPFQNGRTLALIPLAFVPRVIWPDKPTITIGQWITESYRVGGERIDSRIGPSWIGEFYLNFGTLGVVGGMFVMGFLLRTVHSTLFHPGASTPMVVAAVIVLYEVLLKIQGGVASAVNGPVVNTLPLIAIHVFIVVLGGTMLLGRTGKTESSALPLGNSGVAE